MSSWWAAAPDDRLWQGDVITGVPVVVAAHPLEQLSRNKGETNWTPSAVWAPKAQDQGVANVLARGRVGAVLVLSHECQLDKKSDSKKGRVVVAPVAPITQLPEGADRDVVLAQKHFAKMPLPDLPILGTSYADLHLTTAVDQRYLDVTKRLASLSEEGLGRLRLQLIAFFTRLNAERDVASLRKRST